MNLTWTMRILRGPMRPFLMGKLVDRLRQFRELRRARRLVPTMPSEGRSLRTNIVPLPSAPWFAQHGQSVMAFSRRMRSGIVGAYGIDRWNVGQPDPTGVDVRSVHELSRMHHWCAYALAAHLDAARRDEWCQLLEDEITTFASAYPAGSGVHWQFPMGTGIRLHAMLVAWDWAQRSGWRSVDGDRIVAATAIDHALLTFAERESRGGLSTSHYAANLLGVLAAAVYVEGIPETDRWKHHACKGLLSEITRQILPDGMSNEASTGYHRQIVDTFVHALHLMHAAETPIRPEVAHQTLVLSAVARCRQLERLGMPLIGDNDDGLSMKLCGFEPEMSYTYDVAERLHGAAAMMRATTDMQAFGLAVLEDEHLQCTLRNGPVGQFGKGGHAHNDQNSITLRCDGRWVIVDPGTSTYTMDTQQRNQQRSPGMHSTMWPIDAHQAEYPPGETGLFWLLEDRLERTLARTSEGAIRGEVARADVGRHVRQLWLEQGALHGHDVFTGNAESRAESVFVFHPDARIVQIDDQQLVLASGQTQLVLLWKGAQGRIDQAIYSERFASVRTTSCLRLHGSNISWSIRREVP